MCRDVLPHAPVVFGLYMSLRKRLSQGMLWGVGTNCSTSYSAEGWGVSPGLSSATYDIPAWLQPPHVQAQQHARDQHALSLKQLSLEKANG